MAGRRLSKQERKAHKHLRDKRRHTRDIPDDIGDTLDGWDRAGVGRGTATDVAMNRNGIDIFVVAEPDYD